MSGWYFIDLVDVLEAAGVGCRVADVNTGWERRARSSGGFPETPLGIVWHHTASSASPESDLGYMIHGSDDAPIGNMLLDRDGIAWPIAAGGANTQGKGGPAHFSRGTVPVDSGNSRLFAIEACNAGTGEQWPAVQVDAYFAASNAINAYLGNLPSDVITHAINLGDGWTDRKIDPATAYAVRGSWMPGSVNSSGTWDLDDIRHECARRAGTTPPPRPSGDLVFTILDITGTDVTFGGNMDTNGIAAQITWLSFERYNACLNLGAPVVEAAPTDLVNCDLLGPIPPGFSADQFANVIA